MSFCGPALSAGPGSGCWHSSKTAVTERTSGGDPAPRRHCRSDAARPTGPTSTESTSVSDDAESWRHEVAARLERYRARRRPRLPRYPSLFLPFDSIDTEGRQVVEPTAAPPSPREANTGLETHDAAATANMARDSPPGVSPVSAPASKVIEFRRSAVIPLLRAPELAEPVLDRPRIVEAPEIVPPPPALGGILIDPLVAKESEKNNSFEVLAAPATIAQRLAAGFLDALILGAALSAFTAVFFRINPERGPLPLLAGCFLAVALLLWCAYEFLFVVYTGSTPGLLALKLRLLRFDGSSVSRRSRRWRVLASFLSALSLGLGFLWSVLDDEELCWHDRITHTYIQARTQAE